MNHRLPVTLVGGFPGAGKTSLLHHLISEHQGGHFAVLVENPGPLNLDAKAIRGLCGAMRRTNDAVFEIPDGDEASQVEAIAACLRDLSLAGKYERVLIEVAGTANASRLAQNFGIVPGQPDSFSPWAELHQIVCVVDAFEYFRSATETDASLRAFEDEQIAGASLIVLNKCDLLEGSDLKLCSDRLRAGQPGVPVIETAYGEVPPEILLGRTAPRALELAFERCAQQVAKSSTGPELASALYRVYRPFHPQRFWDWFNANHSDLLRVKGLVWLASRNLLVGGVSRTRWQNSCGAAGIWWAALPREDWPEEPDALMRMQETWREPYGDRRQELVMIGNPLLLSTTMRHELDACLLTDEEYARPVNEWATFPDPFPAWDMEE